MHNTRFPVLAAVAALILGHCIPALTQGASQSSAKMFCWKNKAGKTECGDKVPYEYQESAIKELNKQGVVTGHTESMTADERKAHEEALAKAQVEEQRKADQRRQDRALLDTFSNDKEIELKRARDVQLIDSTIETLQTNQKNISEREAYARSRAAEYVKTKRAVPPSIQDEIERASSDRVQNERLIDQKRKEIVLLNQRYDGIKKRYAELTGGTTVPTPTATRPKGSSADPRSR